MTPNPRCQDCLFYNQHSKPNCAHAFGRLIPDNEDCKYHESWRGCKKCQRLVKSRSQIVWGYGNKDAEIMFIGEAPGHLGADKTGIPFKGDRSGDVFKLLLRYLRLDRSDVYTTNIVKCCPPKNTTNSARTPRTEEIKNCRPWLDQEIRNVNPKIIISIGSMATSHFVDFSYMSEVLYMPIDLSHDRILIAAYHPAYIIRQRWDKYDYFKNIKKALKLAEWKK